MKKLRLKLDKLEVSSFEADEAGGSVYGMDGVQTGRCGASGLISCNCTAEVGCYPSKWCTGPGCIATAAQGCETADNSPC